MLGAVVALPSADLLAHPSARCASFGTIDHISFWVGTAAIVLVEVLGAHLDGFVGVVGDWLW